MGRKRKKKPATSDAGSSNSRKACKATSGVGPSKQSSSTFPPGSQPTVRFLPRGYDPNQELFENIDVNGHEIKVCKGGLRRSRHLYIVDMIKQSDTCLKEVCNVQQMLIRKGFYMMDSRCPQWYERVLAYHADNELKCAQQESKLPVKAD